MINILELAQEYLPNKLEKFAPNRYRLIPLSGSELDSVVIFVETNSYFRFSNRKGGGPREFLQYIVGMTQEEIEDILGDNYDNDTSLLTWHNLVTHVSNQKSETELSLQDVVGAKTYHPYIKQRGINEKTSQYYGLEIKHNNVYIPLWNEDVQRVGSIIRNTHAQSKGDRYTTKLVGTHVKPSLWPFFALHKLRGDTIIILVEGAWSVMRIHQVIGQRTLNIVPIATLGTHLAKSVFNYLYEYPIIAILDNDTGGERIAEQLRQFEAKGMSIEMYLPELDNDNNAQYVDDMTDKQLQQFFNNIYHATKFNIVLKKD